MKGVDSTTAKGCADEMKKKYCSNVSIIVLMVLLLSFVLTSIMLVYWDYSMSEAKNPFIVDALTESLPRIAIVGGIQVLAFLIAYLGFRSVFAETPEDKQMARATVPERQPAPQYPPQQGYMSDGQGGYPQDYGQDAYGPEDYGQDAYGVQDGYDDGYNQDGYDPQDEAYDQEYAQQPVQPVQPAQPVSQPVHQQAPVAQQPVKKPAQQVAPQRGKQMPQTNPQPRPQPVNRGYGPGYNNGYDGVDDVPESESDGDDLLNGSELAAILSGSAVNRAPQAPVQKAPEPPVMTDAEKRALAALEKALVSNSINENYYSVGTFVVGRVSIFKGEGGVWRVSRPNDRSSNMARGYRSVQDAAKKFAELVSRIREVPQ